MAGSNANEQLTRLTRRAEHVVEERDLAERLLSGRPLRVKLGVDPTAGDVTLGWAVPLRKLRQFQDEGHTAVLIIGDFTARIGDPSGKTATRPQLAPEEVSGYAEAVLDQLYDILSKDNLEIRYNSEWLGALDLTDVLRLTSTFTVAQMLERDDFSNRHAANKPISIIEFMYPLLQAYDSVAVAADVELGGTDQLFNLLVGRDLLRAFDRPPQIALTMPLLVGLDGEKKMSQSLNNYVAIREEPVEMFGKLMSVSDDVLATFTAIAAWGSEEEIAAAEEAVRAGGSAARDAKRKMARSVVALYHGSDAASGAEAAFDRVFREGRAPERVEDMPIPEGAIDGDKVYLPRVLAERGLAESRSHARRLIAQGGVRLDGNTVEGDEVLLADARGSLLQVGKRRFVRLT